MARIRTVKPEFFTSEQIVELSPIARLLFVGLWVFCDDGGRHPASCKSLKMQVFPGDDISISDISGMVSEMVKSGLVLEYQANGKSYWQVTGWHHQKIDRPTYRYPAPKKEEFDEQSSNDRRMIVEQSAREWNGMESNGMESNGKKIIEREAPNAADKIENKKSEEGQKETTPPIAPAPSPSDTAYQWAVQNLDFLKAAKDQAAFDGKVKDQVLKFCAHYSEYDAFCNQPVKFFKNKFAAWLITAKENAAKFKPRKRIDRQKSAADQVTREKVLEHIKSAHGALSGEITEREVSALIQCADMPAMRERCAEMVKSKMNDNNFSPSTRTGEVSTLAGLVGKIGQA